MDNIHPLFLFLLFEIKWFCSITNSILGWQTYRALKRRKQTQEGSRIAEENRTLHEYQEMWEDCWEKQNRYWIIHAIRIDSSIPWLRILSWYLANWSSVPAVSIEKIQHFQQCPHAKQTESKQKQPQ